MSSRDGTPAMKTTAVTAGVVLLVLALSYSLVRLDVVDAEILRFLPPLLAVVIAVAIISGVLRARRSRPARTPKKKEKGGQA